MGSTWLRARNHTARLLEEFRDNLAVRPVCVCVLRMKYFGLAFAFMLAGAATAAELRYEAPPPKQVFTPVSAVDWTGFHFGGDSTGGFSDAFSGTPFAAPMVPFRMDGWLGSLRPGEDIQNGQFVSRIIGNPDLAGVQVVARDSGTDPLASEMTKSGTHDSNGVQALGVDISKVGSTPTKVRRFLVALPADAASKVRSGCAAVMGDQDKYHPRLVRFCTVLPQKSVATIN